MKNERTWSSGYYSYTYMKKPTNFFMSKYFKTMFLARVVQRDKNSMV